MAKKNLEEILKRVSVKLEDQRKKSNAETHVYILQYSKVLEQLHSEIIRHKRYKQLPIDRLRDTCDKYIKAIVNKALTIKSTAFSYRVGLYPGGYKIIITNTSGSGSVFDQAIRTNLRKEPLKVLRKEVYAILKEFKPFYNTKTITNPDTGDKIRTHTAQYTEAMKITHGTLSKKGVHIGGLLEVGHDDEHSVIKQELIAPKIEFTNLIDSLPTTQRSVADTILANLNFELITNTSINNLRQGEIRVEVFDQGKGENNRQSAIEKQIRKDFIKAIHDVLAGVNLAELPGSPNVPKVLKARIHKTFSKDKTNTVDKSLVAIANRKFTTKASQKVKSTKNKIIEHTESLAGGIKVGDESSKGEGPTKETTSKSWSYLLPIIQSKLTNTIIANMGSPRLNNRTGRFAHSVQAISVDSTTKGFPTVSFSYDSEPYDVFDKFKGALPWNTPERNPRSLIEVAIREILREEAITRFFTRRVQ